MINICIHYLNYSHRNKDPFNLLVRFDATCSGIQHISSLLRSKTLGEQVNICSTNDYQSPKDLYSTLIPPIKNQIENLANNHPDYSNLAGQIVYRTFVKKIVKTIPYHVSALGIMYQIALLGKLITNLDKETNKTYYTYQFIGRNGEIIIVSRNVLLSQASKIRALVLNKYPELDNIFKLFGHIVKANTVLAIPNYWTVPSGNKITKNYNINTRDTYKFRIGNKTTSIILYNKTPIKNESRTDQGIVPNFIHSLDGSLFTYIAANLTSGYIFGVHDCFIVHPNDLPELINQNRYSFNQFYANYDIQEDYINSNQASILYELYPDQIIYDKAKGLRYFIVPNYKDKLKVWHQIKYHLPYPFKLPEGSSKILSESIQGSKYKIK